MPSDHSLQPIAIRFAKWQNEGMTGRAQERVQSASRAFQLLGIIVQRAPASLRVTEAAKALSVSNAIAHRLLTTMVSEGFATRLPDRTYTVGPLSLRMAWQWLEPLQEAAFPHLERVTARTGGSAHLFQLVGRSAVPIARVSSKGREPLEIERDSGYPLWATAGGKAILAQLSRVQQVMLLPPEPYPKFTPSTITQWRALRASLESDVFVDRGEMCPDLACVARPFVVPGRDGTLALAVSVPVERSDAELVDVMSALADAISA
jgi:DNA-binding IclR family transcriptional regulator